MQDDGRRQSKTNLLKEDNDALITLNLGAFPPRYKDICLIGCGAKSLIFSAIDQTSLRRLAIKKVSIGEKDTKDLSHILREIRILNHLDHQNIVKIYHVLLSTSDSPLDDKEDCVSGTPTTNGRDSPSASCLYIGMELMDTDLHTIISKNVLHKEYVRLFFYQILRAMKYLHTANVMHRDLTPSNIFVNVDTLMLKLGDFGGSRLCDNEYDHMCHMTMPLTTKYYQAPELLLHPQHYTKEMDMWSVGCVFFEMLTGKKAFTGEHALEQMNHILEMVPVTKENWQSVVSAGCSNAGCCASPMLFDEQENGGCPNQPLEVVLGDTLPSAINLLKQLLSFDPALRIGAEDGLAHPYFLSYSNPQDEPSCSRPFHIEDEIDECSMLDLEAFLMNENYSINSSFSRSTDANASQSGLFQGVDDAGLLRANSSAGLVINGSYRHLLSLAENNQSEALSESEVRNIACDLDYGVQIHECSMNKDRMSMDFRPITTNAGCFDPYKWDHNTDSDAAAKSDKKDPLSILKLHKSLEATQSGMLRLETHYHSSSSSSMTNRMSNVPSHWSLSSLDISSDHEQRHGSVTPDSISSPLANASNDIGSSANSPTFQEETQVENSMMRRHNGSLHQSGSRRTHHSHHHHHHHSHHHHHHHHHHHGKHKNRHSAAPSSCSQQKTGGGDSSNEQLDLAPSEKHNKHDSGKNKTLPVRVRDPHEPFEANDTAEAPSVVPKHIIITAPDNGPTSNAYDQILDRGIPESSDEITQSLHCEVSDKLHGDGEAQPGNNSSMTKHPNSAFSNYDTQVREDLRNEEKSVDNKCENLHESLKKGVMVECDEHNEMQRSHCLSQSTIESMWKKDLGAEPSVSEADTRRPRTWSEGCSSRLSRTHESVPMVVKNRDLQCGANMLTCRLVQKIRSQFSQLFSEGCFMSANDASHSPDVQPGGLVRMRHFSDDLGFICSPRAFSNMKNSFEPCESPALASCSTGNGGAA